MEMKIFRAGMMTTVQDAGRTGFRASGVPLSGPMDPFAFRVANMLAGNPEDLAGLEQDQRSKASAINMAVLLHSIYQ